MIDRSHCTSKYTVDAECRRYTVRYDTVQNKIYHSVVVFDCFTVSHVRTAVCRFVTTVSYCTVEVKLDDNCRFLQIYAINIIYRRRPRSDPSTLLEPQSVPFWGELNSNFT